MDMLSRNQYLLVLRKEYLTIKSKKERGKLLDEAAKRTRLERKYLIKKLRPKSNLDNHPGDRKKRKRIYGGEVKAALALCWKTFDYPCGQRLKPLLQTETERLRRQQTLRCSDDTAKKLKRISFRMIDALLQRAKEIEHHKRKYRKKLHPLLYQKIPVKVFSEQNRLVPGNIQVDLVEHCGNSASGEFINTLSTTDITTGWWEGEAVMGKSQERVSNAINSAKERYPFQWVSAHSDNGTEFINHHLYRYCQEEKLEFSRSRPYKKNDNCLVEQKNWTHVKKFVGYLRYDTEAERHLLLDLYRNELRLYKNFFQPVMKLKSKERIGGRMHRAYDLPQTPYQRTIAQKGISPKTKRELRKLYETLNPAQLKREIDEKIDMLWKLYQHKCQTEKVEPMKKLKPTTVSFFIAEQELFRCHS